MLPPLTSREANRYPFWAVMEKTWEAPESTEGLAGLMDPPAPPELPLVVQVVATVKRLTKVTAMLWLALRPLKAMVLLAGGEVTTPSTRRDAITAPVPGRKVKELLEPESASPAVPETDPGP